MVAGNLRSVGYDEARRMLVAAHAHNLTADGSGATGGFRRVPALALRGREAPIDVWVA